MRTLPEFFQGPVTRDFQGILDADPSAEAASSELSADEKKPSSDKKCPLSGSGCTGHKKKVCPTGKPPKKAAAFQPDVQGWSVPPAPPAF